MKLVSIETIPGQEFEALDIVRGTVVYSKNFGRDFMAGMKTLVGGEITGYTEMLGGGPADRHQAHGGRGGGSGSRREWWACGTGLPAVMQGAAEVIAYGTAVRILMMRVSFLGHSGFLLELPGQQRCCLTGGEGELPAFAIRAAPAGLCQPPPSRTTFRPAIFASG